MRQLFLPAGLLVGLLLLASCNSYVNTQSGEAYLARYQAQTDGALDPGIEAAARVEPLLTFPARIGIAKLGAGDARFPVAPEVRLLSMRPEEQALWLEAAGQLGPGFGEFVPVSPLVAEMTRQLACEKGGCARSVVEEIRLAAARQHLDAVLVYELATRVERYDNPLWLTQLVLIGLFMAPSEHADVDGVGQAMLIDVRNGYVYGTVNRVVEKAASTVNTAARINASTLEARQRAELRAAEALAAEVVTMGRELHRALERRPAATAAVRTAGTP